MRQYNDYIGERSTCLRDINLLHLQVVKDIGERLQRHELSSTDVLLALPWKSVYARKTIFDGVQLTSTLKLTISSRQLVRDVMLSTTSRSAASLNVFETRLGLTAHMA